MRVAQAFLGNNLWLWYQNLVDRRLVVFLNSAVCCCLCLKGELNRQPLLDFPKDYCNGESKEEMKQSTRKFVNALRFSSVILLKFGYRDTTISDKILGIDYNYIIFVEWLLGYYILAALAVTISNTLPVVNSLISGVF